MFCYQCEQTVQGKGCEKMGVCGKNPEISDLQDVLLMSLMGISMYANRARSIGAKNRDIDRFIIEGLFTTVTNVNFDPERLNKFLDQSEHFLQIAKKMYSDACRKDGVREEVLTGPALWSRSLVTQKAEETGIVFKRAKLGEDITGLHYLIIYGLKGMAAYADHAKVLGVEDDEVYEFFHKALDFLAQDAKDINALLGMALQVGEVNLKVMAMLDKANTGAYGDPVPTSVRIEPLKGKAILVSGHDLKDLEALLKQTEGKGLNIYTHGEMLPAHGYPKLKKFKHLVGNYGGAWQDQAKEFDAFPGSILMTTNCIQKPKETYKARIFTSGLVAWPGVKHVSNSDFSEVINAALVAPGFDKNGSDKTITVGFGHAAVMSVADKVIDAVKAGKIRRFFLIGGCDGAKSGRNYYTDMAQKLPKDCVILTLACGKYRFNKMDFGDIGGIPRLLDIGQCNDAYSAIMIAVALANAFKTDVNSLPLSMILSWYEQKAVCILLTLLHLGIKNIKLGPSLPAFVTPAVLNVLVEKFNIAPIGDVDSDLKAILG